MIKLRISEYNILVQLPFLKKQKHMKVYLNIKPEVGTLFNINTYNLLKLHTSYNISLQQFLLNINLEFVENLVCSRQYAHSTLYLNVCVTYIMTTLK